MSPEQPAENLARLRLVFPLWTISRAGDERAWFAARRVTGERIRASTLAELEALLREAERHRPAK